MRKNFIHLLLLILSIPTVVSAQTGSVTGTLRTREGTPAVGVRVAAIPPGDPVLASITQTDANGAYRLENLTPGPYYITAGLVDFPTYYPGSTSQVSAMLVNVTATAPITGLNFVLARPASIKVSGRVVGALPSTLSTRRVTLLPRQNGSIVDTIVNADGTFLFSNVRPGSYNVNITGAALRENLVITVADQDITGLELESIDTETITRREGLELAWSLEGRWSGVAASSGNLHGILNGSLLELDATGKTVAQPSGRFATTPVLRTAQFAGRSGPVFLGFGTWSATVGAYDRSGQPLWSYPPPDSGLSGIDDVWVMDLDGDKSDEVIVGFNGGGGVHVLNSSGQRVWDNRTIGNVWHVSAGDVAADGKPRVVTTSARGQVHVFSTDGADRQDINPGFYANMVRVGQASGNVPATILASTGGGQPQTIVAAMTGTGTIKWTLAMEAGSHSAEAATGKPWFALGLQGGQVQVIDFERGVVIASIDGQGMRPEVTWLAGKDGGAPLLVISTGSKLSAYRIVPAN